ncbi:MAG: flippase-like domain-containing protein [Desulfobacterota bacterium]|nr:flippase-like domain-containing protein [Thermodesulfobacteriota bacterium]MDW8002306.1 lysylphosphatidylglycerol synthase transmembrane domain-containing protein [Deltaproteobacteria bacterium]
MKIQKEKWIKISGIGLSLALLYLAIRGVKPELVLETLRRLDIKMLFIPVFFVLIASFLSAAKWSKIVGYGVSVKETFVSLIIGLFINNVLPARIGEIVRAYVLAKKRAIPFSYSFSTVIIDRFFDLVGLLLLVFVFFPRTGLPLWISKLLVGFVGFMVLGVIILISAGKDTVFSYIIEKITKKGKKCSGKIVSRIREIHKNVRRINSPVSLAYISFISFFQWLCMSFSLYMVIKSFGISINPFYVPFVCAFLNIGITLPSSPGYVGLYQFLLVYLLSIFDVPKHEGFSVSIIYHATWYFPYTFLGAIFFVSEHLGFKELYSLKDDKAT